MRRRELWVQIGEAIASLEFESLVSIPSERDIVAHDRDGLVDLRLQGCVKQGIAL